MKPLTQVIIVLAIVAVCSGAFIYMESKSLHIVSVSSWVDNKQIGLGETIYTGETIRIITQITDAKTTPKDLVVTIIHRPKEGNWTSSPMSFNSTLGCWYTDWGIPVDAAIGPYDVDVNVVNGNGESTSDTITGQFKLVANPSPIIVSVSSWVDNKQIGLGETIYTGETIRIITQITDAKTTPKDLVVTIIHRPKEGNWTSSPMSFNSTLGCWYTDWGIPVDAAIGPYDVKVNVANGRGGIASSTITGQFNLAFDPSPIIHYIRSWVNPEAKPLEQGGTVATGKILELYTQVSDARTAAGNLTVTISFRPRGGSWITPNASYSQMLDYWYFYWRIPSNATAGSYDVKVDVANKERSTTSTISNAFNVRVKSVLAIYEGEASFWTPSSSGSGSIDIFIADQSGTVQSGTSALRYQIVAGTRASVDIYHSYASPQDWSDYGALDIWWYGRNTGARLDLHILGSNSSSQFSSSFADDFTGWQKVTLPVGGFTETGSPRWWNVTGIQIGTSATTPFTMWYLDKITMEPAAIVYVKSAVDPEAKPLEQGGIIATGKILILYTQVSDAKTAPGNLTVTISFRPRGGSWITPNATYSHRLDYWYIYWRIPSNVTVGSYDAMVNVSTPDHRSTISTTSNAFNISTYVLYMPFDDASVPVKDVSGYGNDGTPYNVTWQSSYGGCYSFNGVNSYINRLNMTGLSNTQLYFSFWSKQGGTSSNYMHLMGFFGDHRATILVLPDTHFYYCKFSNVSGISYETPIGNLNWDWHHTAVIFDGTKLCIYVDGVQKVNINALGVINNIDDSLFVGTTGTGAYPSGNYFNGLIDGIRVYAHSLSADEVKAEYNAGKAEHGIPYP